MTFASEKSRAKICATSIIFNTTTHCKQSPNWRKVSQSGHPAVERQRGDIFFSHQEFVVGNLEPILPPWVTTPRVTLYIFIAKIFSSTLKNALACYNAGVVDETSEGFGPGDTPTIVSYNATSSLVRFEHKKIFSSTLKKHSSAGGVPT
jgi:hypothetical protein